MHWQARLRLVQDLTDREVARLRKLQFPNLEKATIIVAWQPDDGIEKYGEFVGIAEAESSVADSGHPNATVFLFAKYLTQDFGTGRRLAREVRITLLHELGHAVGFDEDDLARLGLD